MAEKDVIIRTRYTDAEIRCTRLESRDRMIRDDVVHISCVHDVTRYNIFYTGELQNSSISIQQYRIDRDRWYEGFSMRDNVSIDGAQERKENYESCANSDSSYEQSE